MTDTRTLRRTILGVLAGGALFLGFMLLLASIAITFGWLRQNPAGPVNLRPWLTLAVIGGAPASVLGGVVSRRISRRDRGPVILALLVLSFGFLEGAEILRQSSFGSVAAPVWLVLLAPVVAAAGTLFGGWLSGKASPANAAQQGAAADRAARDG